jgi:hypothetical protein
MTDNTAIVFHGFLNLSMLEKKALVDAMNEFFDEIPERERIRRANAEVLSNVRSENSEIKCSCCGAPVANR